MGEITGTGYARTSQALPTPTAGALSFTISTWNTAGATDWPSAVRSIVLVSTADNSGKAICAWNLIPGNGARDMSHASTIESVTPTLTTESVDMSFASTVASIGFPSDTGFDGPTAPFSSTIIPLSTVITDVGSNVVDNGTFKIYLVPSTGVYEINFGINCDLSSVVGATGASITAYADWGFGSSSAGTTTPYSNLFGIVQQWVAGQNHISWTGYAGLTAGQYVNLMWGIPNGVTTFTSHLNTAEFDIQRIA